VTALLLALAYRSWLLTSDDEVQDDVEDRDVALHGAPDDDLDDTGGDADRERDEEGDAA
jgi:multicomponent Na+:H+ antiporter subunit C